MVQFEPFTFCSLQIVLRIESAQNLREFCTVNMLNSKD